MMNPFIVSNATLESPMDPRQAEAAIDALLEHSVRIDDRP